MPLTIALIGNGLIENPTIIRSLIQQHSKVFAIDGGLYFCKENGITPNLIIGDLDSIHPNILSHFSSVPILRFPPDKNETDTELAIIEALKLHPKKIYLYGELGKRTDHTLYNLSLIQKFAFHIEIVTETERIFALKPHDQVETFPGQTVSLIPLMGPVSNVTSLGLKWELDHILLNHDFISISNISIGNHFVISYDQGCLICCLQKT